MQSKQIATGTILCITFLMVTLNHSEAGLCCPAGSYAASEIVVGFDTATTDDRVQQISVELGASVIERIVTFEPVAYWLVGVERGEEQAFIPLFLEYPEVHSAEVNAIFCPPLPACTCCPEHVICPDLPEICSLFEDGFEGLGLRYIQTSTD